MGHLRRPDKAVEIAELGLRKCKRDQTEILIYLLRHAQETGDEIKAAKLIKGAKLRKAVNFAKVQVVMLSAYLMFG